MRPASRLTRSTRPQATSPPHSCPCSPGRTPRPFVSDPAVHPSRPFKEETPMRTTNALLLASLLILASSASAAPSD